MAMEILSPKYFKKAFTKTYIYEESNHQVVLEQFGRMRLQNGFSLQECRPYIFDATWRLLNGQTGHQVAAYLRQVRNHPGDTQETSITTGDPDTTAKSDENSGSD